MARGFESKSVADQQEEAQNRRTRPQITGDPAVLARRRKLELGRAAVLEQMAAAHAEAHREMLRRALADLEQQLAALG